MNTIRSLLPLSMLIALLGACTTVPEPGPEVGEPRATTQVRPGDGTSRPVLALLEQANRAARQGELAVAEARLERALRIEPRNAVLWYYMAKLRLHQGRLEEAAGLAAKSNSLDRRDNRRLQADNWRIIAHARHQSGDESGARDAEQRAGALSDQH